MLVGEESSILNVAYPLYNRWNACKEVGTILSIWRLQIVWLVIILSVKFVFLRI